MKSWTPTRDFHKADFIYNQKKKISESNSKQTQLPKQEKTIKAWSPPRIENLKNSKQTNLKKTLDEQPTPLLLKKNDFDASKEYLEQIFQSSFLESLDILRNWYWKKNEMYEKKIYVILKSISNELLKKTLLSMSSIERSEFIKIYQNTYSVSKTEILSFRKEFLEIINQL